VAAYVLMSNHFHLVVHFPNASRISAFMRDLKSFSARMLRAWCAQQQDALRLVQQPKVWARRFHSVPIFSVRLASKKVDYIHNNPVKPGLAENPLEYENSSCRYFEFGDVGALPVVHYTGLPWQLLAPAYPFVLL